MAKFNKKATAAATQKAIVEKISHHETATTNHEDGLAFKVSSAMELYLTACSALLNEQVYEAEDAKKNRIRKLIKEVGPAFTLKLAAYVRQEMKLRSLPIMLLAEASVLFTEAKNEAKPMVREYTPRILQRADEPAEVIAYWNTSLAKDVKKKDVKKKDVKDLKTNKNKIVKTKPPKALQRGISDALNNFNAYQLAKNNGSNKSISLRDVLRVIHPVPKNAEQSEIYKMIMEDRLPTPETWETYISANGSTKDTWEYIAGSMPFFALLRNLRNFEEKGADNAIKIAIAAFNNKEHVQKSKLLPFRFLTAEREVSSRSLKDALRVAMNLAVDNIPKWGGRTAIFNDNSGSMSSARVSSMGSSSKTLAHRSRQQLTAKEVAGLMSAIALHLSEEEYLVGAFGDRYSDVKVSKLDSILTNAEKISNKDVGHSTDAYLAIEHLRKNKILVDRIFIFSDMQCYDSYRNNQSLAGQFALYKNEINKNVMLYSVDLAGHGTSQFLEKDPNVMLLSGFSEKIFSLVRALENKGTIIDEINEKW